MSSHLFVTGMPRSGTTLLDKLLSAHDQALVFSQPLPLLYVRVKQAFLKSLRADRPRGLAAYPLNDMVGANYYPPADLLDFLATLELSHDFCRAALEEMIPFDGQYTKPRQPFRILERDRPTSLHGFVAAYCAALEGTRRLSVVGSKETFCEEYIPYFLACGSRVVEILRDPRDVVASLDYGDGQRFGGRSRPLLLILRQWRKSVAFALAHQDEPSFLAVRYEDLVRHPQQVMARITAFLEIDRLPRDVLLGDLRTQAGAPWRSNSSHHPSSRITADSVGRYRQHLPRETDVFVQAVCFAELKRLGYDLDVGDDEVSPILDRHVEPRRSARPELSGYAWSAAQRRAEQERWRKLRERDFAPEWFVFEQAFEQLSSCGIGR